MRDRVKRMKQRNRLGWARHIHTLRGYIFTDGLLFSHDPDIEIRNRSGNSATTTIVVVVLQLYRGDSRGYY